MMSNNLCMNQESLGCKEQPRLGLTV